MGGQKFSLASEKELEETGVYADVKQHMYKGWPSMAFLNHRKRLKIMTQGRLMKDLMQKKNY